MTHPYLEAPITADIRVNMGSTFKLAFTWYDDTDSSIVDITGATVRLMARTDETTASPAISWVSPTNITLSATAPTITIEANAAITEALTAGDYGYDIEVDFGSNDIVRLLTGKCLISRGYTH